MTAALLDTLPQEEQKSPLHGSQRAASVLDGSNVKYPSVHPEQMFPTAHMQTEGQAEVSFVQAKPLDEMLYPSRQTQRPFCSSENSGHS